MKSFNIKYLAGGPIEKVKPLQPYDSIVCDFLSDLSKSLQKDKRAMQYPDVLSFAFFCRKGNISRLADKFKNNETRLGRGIAFHIAPSNVPVNCAFTYVFGLLSGNANVVRVSTKEFEQVNIICDVIQKMFDTGEYDTIKKMTAFVSYERNREINDLLSAMSNVRVIWGGDNTINELRKSPISSRCTELTFADRYSFAIVNPETIADAETEEVKRLAEQFYNDTYLMDQNACSTPHIIIWKGSDDEKSVVGKKKFWGEVANVAKKYNLADIKVSDKYVQLCKYEIEMNNISHIEKYENFLYVISLSEIKEDITNLRGKFGLFFQYDVSDLSELIDCITNKVQTCTYFGIKKEELIEFVVKNSLLGIDRIVPLGSSLDIGTFWDGYDIIRHMSRLVM